MSVFLRVWGAGVLAAFAVAVARPLLLRIIAGIEAQPAYVLLLVSVLTLLILLVRSRSELRNTLACLNTHEREHNGGTSVLTTLQSS